MRVRCHCPHPCVVAVAGVVRRATMRTAGSSKVCVVRCPATSTAIAGSIVVSGSTVRLSAREPAPLSDAAAVPASARVTAPQMTNFAILFSMV